MLDFEDLYLIRLDEKTNELLDDEDHCYGKIDDEFIIFYNGETPKSRFKLSDLSSIKRGIYSYQIVVTLSDNSSLRFYSKYLDIKHKDDLINDGSLDTFYTVLKQFIPGIDDGYLFYDTVSHNMMIDTHILGKSGIVPFTDDISTKISLIIERETENTYHKGKFRFSKDTKWEIYNMIATAHPRNLFMEHISSIKWDGERRCRTLLSDCGFTSGVLDDYDDDDYLSTVSLTIFKATIDRQLRDNVKLDFVPIFVGEQGLGKSTLCEKLVFYDTFNPSSPENYYREYSKKDITKDQIVAEATNGAVLVEFMEGIVFGSDDKALKSFFDRIIVQYRKPYNRTTSSEKVSYIVIATTNEDTFLTDLTGARRYFPVELKDDNPKINIKYDLTLDYIEQCWAEALTLYKTEVSWKEDIDKIKPLSTIVQRTRFVKFPGYDELKQVLSTYYSKDDKVIVSDLKRYIDDETCLSSIDTDNLFKFLKKSYRHFGLRKCKSPFKDNNGKSVRGYILDRPEMNE